MPEGVVAVCQEPPEKYRSPDPDEEHLTGLIDLGGATGATSRGWFGTPIDRCPGLGGDDAITGQPSDLLDREHPLKGEITEAPIDVSHVVLQLREARLEVANRGPRVAASQRPTGGAFCHSRDKEAARHECRCGEHSSSVEVHIRSFVAGVR